MNHEIRSYLRQNNYLYSYLREESYQYKYLYRDRNYLKKIEKQAKEKYQMTTKDKLEQIKNKIEWVNTIISAIE